MNPPASPALPHAEFLSRLSKRELQVMTLLARGKTIGEVSRALDLEHSTISTYRERIMTKLGLRSFADLVMIAHDAGLCKSPKLQ